MRTAILILALLVAAEATAQEQPPLWDKLKDALAKFVPPQQPPSERPVEQSLDAISPGNSPDAERQTLWESATKITADQDADTATSSPTTATSAHPKDKCLDPSNFQPGLAGHLDYYLFTVVDMGPHELYLAGEHSKQPFCLTGVDTEDLEKAEQVVILGNVRVRGTKTYKTEQGDKINVRVVKLLSPEESELADAERALEETEHPVRTWTSKDGKHKIEARFLRFVGGKVYLVNSAGKNITIAPNNLSVEDREYYRALVKKAREAARKTDEVDDADDPGLNGGEIDSRR
jgi:hypothetical protein